MTPSNVWCTSCHHVARGPGAGDAGSSTRTGVRCDEDERHRDDKGTIVTPTIHEITVQAIHDALTLAGPDADGCGYLRTTAPADYMGAERLRLARAVLKSLPPGTTPATASEVAVRLAPLIRAMLHR